MNYIEYQSIWRGTIRVPVAQVAIRRSVVEEIADDIYRETGVTPKELFSDSRTRRVARARQEAMWRLRQLTDAAGHPRYSFPEIGRAFNRDHATAMFACWSQEERVSGFTHPTLAKKRVANKGFHRAKSSETCESPQVLGNHPQHGHSEAGHGSCMENRAEIA